MSYRKVKIGDFLSVYRFEHKISDEQIYRQVTISKFGEISLRGEKVGLKIGRKRQFQIDLKTYPNTVLFTRQGLSDGAIGIAPTVIDKCVVTENMPMLTVNTSVIVVDFLRILLRSEYFFEKIKKIRTVGSAQKSIHERDLLKVEINLPSIEEQKILSKKLKAFDVKYKDILLEIVHQKKLLKKLRQQILQDAIEGKLTAEWRKQNPDVEPATELLKRIAAEKERLIKEKKIKPQKPLPPIKDEEKPFELSDGWVWCRLGNLTSGFQYGTSSKSIKSGEIPVLRMGNIQNGKIFWENLVYSNHIEDNLKFILHKDDLLFNRTNSRELVGKTALYECEKRAIYAGYLVRFHMMGGVSPHYSNFVMNSLLHGSWCNEVKSDALGQSNINATKLSFFRFPLPPSSEQQLIVSKIESFFAVCEQIETQAQQNQEYAEQLMQSVLKEAFSYSETIENNQNIECDGKIDL
jgi:type I restriction enzyme S subunit